MIRRALRAVSAYLASRAEKRALRVATRALRESKSQEQWPRR